MTERIFSAVLTFAMLAGGTFAVGSELLGSPRATPARTLQATAVMLPKVEITGHRATALVALNDAAGDHAADVCVE
jgi:2-keto-4-pentenoate hydratase